MAPSSTLLSPGPWKSEPREASMPTGLPLGGDLNIAVPHTDPEHVVTPSLALATLVRPVSFGSMDDPDEQIPVGVVMMLALADKNAQIDMPPQQ